MKKSNIIKQLIVLILVNVAYSATVSAFNEVQVTNNSMDDGYVDMAIDPAGNVHLVYQRNSKIYHWTESASDTAGVEEFIANGTDPSIAIGPSGMLHTTFMNGSDVNYAKKYGENWQLPQVIADECKHHDIAVDNSNNVHIVYQQEEYVDFFLDSILYTHGTVVPLSVPVRVLASNSMDVLSDWFTLEYSNPSIAIDNSNNYHIVAEKTLNLGETFQSPGTWFDVRYVRAGSDMSIISPNQSTGNKFKLSSNSIIINSKSTPHVAYNQSSRLYISQKSGNTWELLVNEPGRNGAIKISPLSEHLGAAYIDGSSVHYIENNVASGAIASGSGPVLAYGSKKTFIAYAKQAGGNEEIFLASGIMEGSPLINPIADDAAREAKPYKSSEPTLYRGTEPVTWSLMDGPSGMHIKSSTGVVSWLNPITNVRPYTITIRAANSLGNSDESWNLMVTEFSGFDYIPGIELLLLAN